MNRKKFLAALPALLLSPFLLKERMIFSKIKKEYNPVVWEIEEISKEKIYKLLDHISGVNKLFGEDFSQKSFLIKPNLCLAHKSDRGTITNSGTIEFVINYLLDKGVKKIIIADHTLGKTTDFAGTEIARIPEKYPEVKLLLANEERFYQKVELNGKVLKQTDVLKIISKTDIFINFATAKHHAATTVSLAVKNLMGVIWDRAEFHSDLDLQQAIGDLPLAVKPTLNFIDATNVLLTNGPVGPGKILNENKLFCSEDILAVDSIVASRYNFGNKKLSARDITHLNAAYLNGIGEIDTEKIVIEKI